MIPEAYVCHKLASRVRIRVAAKRGETAYFDQACKEFATVAGIASVSANPVTATIVIVHEVELPTVARIAQERGLFRLVSTEAESVRAQTRRSLEGLSHDLTRISDGTWTFEDALFLALVGFAAYEALKGRFAAPAITLAWYAFNTLALPEDRIGTVLLDG